MIKMYSQRQLVIVLNSGIAFHDNKLSLHRGYNQFLEELSDYFDNILLSQFIVKSSEHNLSDWSLSNLSNVTIQDVSILDSHKNIIPKVLNYMAASIKIIKIVRSNQFFYIFLPGNLSILYIILCLLFKKRYALYIRGDWLLDRRWRIGDLYGYLFSNARFILVTGENYLERIKPYNKNVEKVIPMIELTGDDICPRSNYAFNNQINLLFLGRIEKAKGIFDALKAFELLHKINRRLHLTVVGDGPDFIEFEKICKTKRLTKYISLLGMIKNKDKLKEIYKKMDIFIFSSHREGFPRVLYEAMTFGLPIVTTFVGAVGSVMEDGKNCLRVKKQNPNDLGEKIWQLICDEKLREKIGKGATDTILQLFNEFERNSHAKQVIQWMQKTENYLN